MQQLNSCCNLREVSSFGIKDTEYDIYDASVWQWIETLINARSEEVTATFTGEEKKSS